MPPSRTEFVFTHDQQPSFTPAGSFHMEKHPADVAKLIDEKRDMLHQAGGSVVAQVVIGSNHNEAVLITADMPDEEVTPTAASDPTQ